MTTLIVARKMPMTPEHPFYPRALDLPHYVPNTLNGELIFGSFGAICAALVLAVWFAGRSLPTFRRVVLVWCVLSGSIHMTVEGYFVVFYETLASLNTPMGQLWKEYAKCDSRYMWGERAVWMIELITSFAWGPLLYLVAYRLWSAHTRVHRYLPLLVVISTGQLYGTILYFATSLRTAARAAGAPEPSSLVETVADVLNRVVYDDGRPERYYFWIYFFTMNVIWIVVPSTVLIWAMRILSRDPAKAASKKSK
ncbi:hypothetical protein H9P43_004003 [Blastocladiella emersonii ATCC 22665]|nr:hypothetical protein H9P43_004003 [Blastocladiella emersonii ATCC 22665]